MPEGAIEVDIIAYRAIPKSWSKKKKELLNGSFCMAKPDSDNIAGAVMDALLPERTGGDSRVVKLSISKYWADKDEMVITIAPVFTPEL